MTRKAREVLDKMKYESFEKGVRAWWAGQPEPEQHEERFGWNMARRGELKPGPSAHDHEETDHTHSTLAGKTGSVSQ